MKSLPIGSTVSALAEDGLWVECKIVHLCEVQGVAHAILLPVAGGYSFVRDLAALCEPEADSAFAAEEAAAA